jgi:hypothetical protein
MWLFNLVYYGGMVLLVVFIAYVVFGAAAGWVLLGFLVLAVGSGIAEGIRSARQFRKIAGRAVGVTDSARALFDGLAKGMDYQSVAIRAGAPGRLLSESRGGAFKDASYDWHDDGGGCVFASFDNNRLSYSSFHP